MPRCRRYARHHTPSLRRLFTTLTLAATPPLPDVAAAPLITLPCQRAVSLPDDADITAVADDDASAIRCRGRARHATCQRRREQKRDMLIRSADDAAPAAYCHMP